LAEAIPIQIMKHACMISIHFRVSFWLQALQKRVEVYHWRRVLLPNAQLPGEHQKMKK